MILSLFTKLQSVTLEHLDHAEEVQFLLVMLGPISTFILWNNRHDYSAYANKIFKFCENSISGFVG